MRPSPVLRVCIALYALSIAAPVAAATDYYVSALGSDANAGTSPSQPWQSLNRLNFVSFQPGDRIFLEGGTTHDGTLNFDPDDIGTAAEPILLTSYGTGRATINAGTGTAVRIYNTSGIKIVNLSVTSSGRTTNLGSGISAYTDLAGDVKLPFIYIDSVNASGFGRNGIEIIGGNGASGFVDVTIKFVAAWDNTLNGIMSGGTVVGTHRNIYVGYSRALNNPGLEAQDSTGNGIVLGAVDGAEIERCVVSGNGGTARGPHGPIGIWAYHANAVAIHYNESFDNRTGGWADGGGFALDVGVTNSVMEYNYSHGNHGSGFLLAGGFDPGDHANNIVRYNISENDGRRNGFGAFEIWGKTRNTHLYNNTVFTSADASNQSRALFITNAYADGHYPVNVSFRNNIFYTTGNIPAVQVAAPVLAGGSLRFENNNYFATGSPLRIVWGNTTYNTVTAWASATGQETVSGTVIGRNVDPMLGSPGAGTVINDATELKTLSAYTLRASSPMINAGRAVTGTGLDAEHDFYETDVPQGANVDIGAHEWTPETGWTGTTPEIVMYAQDAALLSGNWALASDSTAAGGVKLSTPDLGWSNTAAPLASPTHYVDFTFDARANTRYRLWLRLQARANSKYNDAVFAQFSNAVNGSGAAVYRIGTTSGLTVNMATCATCALSGWGWQNRAYWLSDTGDIWFATSGPQTIRIQVREDGVELDQVVLSPATYLTTAPGPISNDSTIVPKPDGGSPPPPNSPPSISLTSPANNSSYTAPATITVSANATDGDGSITRVEFYNGSAQIGTDTTAPYSISWAGVGAGNYSLTAVAVDDDGARTTSSAARVTVTAPASNQPPSVAITSPANNSSYTAPASITISATASDSDGSVARVEFYSGSSLIGTRTGSPYSITWSNVAAGSYSLTAVAVDNAGAATRSAAVLVTVSAPAPARPPEVVIYAADVASAQQWTMVTDSTAAAGKKLSTADAGWSNTNNALAAPTRYFDVQFAAQANTKYRIWLRLRAQGDSKWNDSLFVQFSNAVNSAGAAIYRIGTTGGLTVNMATCSTCALSGWGWQNRAYWLSDTGDVWFATSGTQTLRIQVREDGVEIDQIVISPARYLTSAPGPLHNDTTIVPKP